MCNHFLLLDRVIFVILNADYKHNSNCMATYYLTNHQVLEHCWKSKSEFISDVLSWTFTHGCTSVSQPWMLCYQHDNDHDKDIYIYMLLLLLATVVEGDQKASFSIATTLKCRGGRYSFPWIAPLYPWYIPYIDVLSEEVSSTIF